MVKRIFPKTKKIVVLPNYDALPSYPDVDAAFSTLAHAKAWTSSRTDYTAVVPKNMRYTILFAYMMPDNSDRFRTFVDYWLRIQRVNGFRDKMVKRWLDGIPEANTTPRWSILRELEGH
jgi:ABC-type amino acid transport substrate-binding protein